MVLQGCFLLGVEKLCHVPQKQAFEKFMRWLHEYYSPTLFCSSIKLMKTLEKKLGQYFKYAI